MPRNRSEKAPSVTPEMVAYLCAYVELRDYYYRSSSTYRLSWDSFGRMRANAWAALPEAQKVVVRQMGMMQRRSIVNAQKSK